LVEAYAQLSSAQWLGGAHADAIASADRAIALAEGLGLPKAARALGYRGMARAYLGDPEGIAEMERALAMLLESGAGRDVSVVHNNIAIARYPVEGVARSLATFESGLDFCRQRGLLEAERVLATNCPGLLAELGRTDEALVQARELALTFEGSGQVPDLVELRTVELEIRHARGAQPSVNEIDWLIDIARKVGHVDVTPLALACAAAALLPENPDRARRVLVEFEQVHSNEASPYYSRKLPTAVRTALAAADHALAEQLVDSFMPRYPLDEHALCSARAQLAERAGDVGGAAALYGDAAGRWQKFGNVPERAYALLGEGRCLQSEGLPEAEEPLRAGRELFASMGYRRPAAEAAALLEQLTPASAS